MTATDDNSNEAHQRDKAETETVDALFDLPETPEPTPGAHL
jgi:hypothetical protein